MLYNGFIITQIGGMWCVEKVNHKDGIFCMCRTMIECTLLIDRYNERKGGESDATINNDS